MHLTRVRLLRMLVENTKFACLVASRSPGFPTLIRGHISDTSVAPFVPKGSTRQKSADLASAAALFLANLMCSQRDVHASGADTDHHQYFLR